MGNVSERRKQPPQVGVSVVILALGTGSAVRCGRWCRFVRHGLHPVDAAGQTRPSAFFGAMALPGGGLRADHSLEQSAYAALESTTSLHPKYLEQLYTFGDPARSHGGLPMVSIVYWALVGEADGRIDFAGGDNVKWFPVNHLPELAFDHRTIVEYAMNRLRGKIESPDIATRLVGERFTLSQLHDVYEAIAGQRIDLANFRRKMLASGLLEDTGEKLRIGRNRPAAVYRYSRKPGTDLWTEAGTASESDDTRIAFQDDDALSALMTA